MGSKVTRFEDLECWQLARELANLVYALTSRGVVASDFGFCDQIRRAAVSVMNNIAEGFERDSNREFAKFLFVARGSAGEVRSMCYLAMDREYLDRVSFDDAYGLAVRCSQTCWGMIRSLQRNADWRSRIAVAISILLPSLFATPQ